MPGLFFAGTFPGNGHLLVPPMPNPSPVPSAFVRPLRSLPLALALTLTSLLPAADEKSPVPPPAPPAAPAKPAAEPVLELPKMEVRQQRIKEIDREIKKLDKLIAREKKRIKTTDLDRALNHEKLARAAAIFGGNSADHMSAVAASRVMLLERERDLMEAMKRPATLDELAMMEKEVEELRKTRRNLDYAPAQR